MKEEKQIQYYDGPILETPSLNYKVINRIYLDSGCMSAVQMDLEFSTAEEIRDTFILKDFVLRDYEGVEIKLLWIQPTVLRLILSTTQEQSGLLDLMSLDDMIHFIDPPKEIKSKTTGTGTSCGHCASVSITSMLNIRGSMDEFWKHVQEVDLSECPFYFSISSKSSSEDPFGPGEHFIEMDEARCRNGIWVEGHSKFVDLSYFGASYGPSTNKLH